MLRSEVTSRLPGGTDFIYLEDIAEVRHHLDFLSVSKGSYTPNLPKWTTTRTHVFNKGSDV